MGLVLSNTPDGVVIHWPDTVLSTVFNNDEDSRMVLEEIPQNPFEIGRNLTPKDTIMVQIDTDSSGSRDPVRELYASAGRANNRNTKIRRCLVEDFKNERGIFTTPMVNIVKTKHLHETIQDTPKIMEVQGTLLGGYDLDEQARSPSVDVPSRVKKPQLPHRSRH